MKLLKVDDYNSMSVYGAEKLYARIAAASLRRERINIGLATGNTMLMLYRLLAEKLNQNGISLARLHTYNLDEYVTSVHVSVTHSHPLSYWRYMHENFFGRLDPALEFRECQAHFPDPENPSGFDHALEEDGGLDLQLLGIGFNGHIAFNEPQSIHEISPNVFALLPTRVIALKELTIQTNAKLTAQGADSVVPRFAVTMGMKQILSAKQLLLLACFPEQKTPLDKILERKDPTPELPASYLLTHPCSEIVYTADSISLTAGV